MASWLKSVFGKVTSVFQKSPSASGETEQTKCGSDSSQGCQSGRPDCIQLSDAVKEKSKLLNQTGPLPVYEIPLKEEQINVAGCKLYSFGKESIKQKRTIMVLGATGAGKSTLINGMINYILGVEWDYMYRFKLVNEDQTKSQAESQTSEVTVYKINHQEGFKIDYSVTIIDTPGFGDTRGIERDREIVEQLRNLFSSKNGVREINAVCFVAQASLARLTPSQKYVFDSVLAIFGKDIAENIRILVTFADGQRPPVLEAINAADVPCPKTKDGQPVHFKFNNSALFADNKSAAANSSDDDEEENFDKMFWNMGAKSMKSFFNALSSIQTKSLTMTQEVLKERKQLEVSVEGLQEQVKIGLAKLEEIKETAEKLKEFEAEISRNEKFEFEIKVKKPFQVDISGSGKFLTNCQQCHFTCHDNCAYADDKDKIYCCAMGRDGKCEVCPGKCIWSVHFNQKYKWEYKEVTEKQTLFELKKKFDIAKEAKSPVEAMIGRLMAEYAAVQTEVEKLIEKSSKCLNKLRQIALRPNPLSTPEYIDMLIEGEKNEAKPGWNKRVQSLSDIRKKAQTMVEVASGRQLLQSPPFVQFNDKPNHDKKPCTNHSSTKTNSKIQKNPGSHSNKNLNEIGAKANQNNTENRKDNKSEPSSDVRKINSKSQNGVLDTHQTDSNLSTDYQNSDPDTHSDQGHDNQYKNNNQDTYLDGETEQDEGDEDTNKDKVGDTVQDNEQNVHGSNQSQESDHDADSDEDQEDQQNSQDPCHDNYLDYETEQDESDNDVNRDKVGDTVQGQEQSDHVAHFNRDSHQDTDPDKDQGDLDNSEDQDICRDTDQSDHDINKDKDSDHHACPDEDQGKQSTQKDQDSDNDFDPDEDQADQHSSKDQDLYHDADQSDHDTNSSRNSDHHADPGQDQTDQDTDDSQDTDVDPDES